MLSRKINTVQPSKFSKSFKPVRGNRKSKSKAKTVTIQTTHQSDNIAKGPMVLILLVSRMMGVAPLSMERTRNGWRVTCSRPFAFYSYALKILLDVLVSTGLYLDFSAPEDRQLMVHSTTECILWCTTIVLTTSISGIGVFTGTGRMTAIIECFNLVSNVQSKAGGRQKHSSAGCRVYCFIISVLGFLIALYLCDSSTNFLDAYFYTHELKVPFFYIAVYVQLFMVVLLGLQFVFAGLLVKSALRTINQQMKNYVRKIDLAGNRTYSLFRSKHFETAIPIPKLQYVGPGLQRKRISRLNSTGSEISLWADSYSVTCEVQKKIHGCFTAINALILGTIFFSLVTKPYYLTSFLVADKIISSIVQVGHMVWLTLKLFLLTEPGNQIETQMLRMQNLLGQVFRRVTPEDDQFKHLECYFQQILLYQPFFLSVGLGKMTRPLVIVIFAGITTYITLVVQLELG